MPDAPSDRHAGNGTLHHEGRWIALVAVGALAPCLAVVAAGRTLSWRDSASLFEPIRPLVVEAIRGFRLPLWNPYEGGGIPLFAQMMHGVLHPWSVLAALLAPHDGMDLMILLHVLTGATGAGVLARGLGATQAGAAVAGLGYGLSGYLLGLTSNLQYLAAGGTAPWAIAAVQRAGSSRPGSIPIGAIAVCALVFAGDPQWTLVAAALGTMLAIEKNGIRGVVPAAASVALGAAVAAVQWWPTWAMFEQTSRSASLARPEIIQWSFTPARVFEFVVPGLFGGLPGSTPAPVFLWFEGASQYPIPFLPSVFVGLPLFICAAWGLNSNRSGRWCVLAAGVLLWMALGHHLFATRVLSWIPVWGSFRYAEKLVGPCTLMVAAAAGLGVTSFAVDGLARMRRLAWAASPSLLACAVVLFISGRTTPGPQHWPAEVWPLLAARLAAGFLLASVTLAWIAFAATQHPSNSILRERWVVALVLSTGLVASPAALHAGRRDARDRQPLAELRKDAVVARVIQPVDQIALPVSRGFDMFDAAQVVRSASGRPSYNVPARIDAFVTYTGLLPRRYSELLARLKPLGPARWIAFRRFGVTNAVLTPPLTQVDLADARAAVLGGTQVRFDPINDIRVFAVPHTPWARFAVRVRQVGEQDAIALTALAAGADDDTVILEGAAPAALGPGSVLSVDRDVDHLRMVADAPSGGLLIVADSWWPGWVARIDGDVVPISRADAIFRAVKWPIGRHVLEMEYKPREVTAGGAISAAAATLLLGMALSERLRRSR